MNLLASFTADFNTEREWAIEPVTREPVTTELDDMVKTDYDIDGVKHAAASEQDREQLQDAFDSVTRITLAIKKIAVSINQNANGDAAREMAKRGLNILKDLADPSQCIENLMIQDKGAVTKQDVCDALASARTPYKATLDYYKELCTIYTNQGYKLDKDYRTTLKRALWDMKRE